MQGVSWNSQEFEVSIISNELNGIHNRFWSTAIYWISSIFIINQCAKKVVFNSPGLVDLQYWANESCSLGQRASEVFWEIQITEEL